MAEPNEQAQAQPQAEAVDSSSLMDDLLGKGLKIRESDTRRSRAQEAVQTLCEYLLQDTNLLVADDVMRTIEQVRGELDRKLTEQINQILHHEDFQKLEGAWRGLHHLVNNTETSTDLKIRVMNISKKDVARTLKKFKGAAWDQSPIFKKLYEDEFGTPGGKPYGCLIGDYEFDHTNPDVELLGEMSKIASAAHTPFLAAASPALMGMESWQDLMAPRDLAKLFDTDEYIAWRSLRQTEDAKYVGLTLPRFLARLPYGANTEPVDDFDFEEDTEGADHNKYTWANAAYAMGANITSAYKLYGWCAAIRGKKGGGAVEGLPMHTFPTDDGGVDSKCPTEIAITDRREKELADLGLIPLSHYRGEDYAVFFGAQSLQKPKEYDDPRDTESAKLAANLPYMFACCRFAHYLKCIVRDQVGTFMERGDVEKWLNNWIMKYVEPDPENATQDAKARRPLAAASVLVKDVEGNPGYYSATFELRPHFQLEGIKVNLRLVSQLKQAGG